MGYTVTSSFRLGRRCYTVQLADDVDGPQILFTLQDALAIDQSIAALAGVKRSKIWVCSSLKMTFLVWPHDKKRSDVPRCIRSTLHSRKVVETSD